MNTPPFMIVPPHVSVYRTKRPSEFGAWSPARKKRGQRGWAHLGNIVHECKWVPARDDVLGHWVYVDLPVGVVVGECRRHIESDLLLTTHIVTSEGVLGCVDMDRERDLYLAGMPSD